MIRPILSSARRARRRAIALAVACGVAAGAAGSAAEAAGAAGLSVRDRLTWMRPDGTKVTFPRAVRMWCGPWASDVPVRSIHVQVGVRSRTGRASWWELHAVLADVRRRPVVRLPNAFVFDRPRGAQLFAVDARNEVNSDQEESTGSIRFGRVRCGRRPRVSFSFEGRVGSELFDGETLAVSGSFRASASPG
jgi:hypothetical protein